ncbi:MAG: hypothetical protein ACYSWO_05570 [Planctomycetota bacterium]|jgi:hypothetical protein
MWISVGLKLEAIVAKWPTTRTVVYLIAVFSLVVLSLLFAYEMGKRAPASPEELKIEEKLLYSWVREALGRPVSEWHGAAGNEDDELDGAYLVFDMDRDIVHFEKEGTMLSRPIELIGSYDWKIYRLTPDATEQLSGVVRLKNRHDRQRYVNTCKEAFFIQAAIGQGCGAHFAIKSSVGFTTGTGVIKPQSAFFNERQYDEGGPRTINQSILVSEEEYQSGVTLQRSGFGFSGGRK